MQYKHRSAATRRVNIKAHLIYIFKLIRISFLFATSVYTMLLGTAAILAQGQSYQTTQQKRDEQERSRADAAISAAVAAENRFTKVESDVTFLKQQMQDLLTKQWAALIGLATLLGEAGVRLTITRKKEPQSE